MESFFFLITLSLVSYFFVFFFICVWVAAVVFVVLVLVLVLVLVVTIMFYPIGSRHAGGVGKSFHSDSLFCLVFL